MTSRLARALAVLHFALCLAAAPAAAEDGSPCASDAPWIEIAASAASVSAEGGVGGTGRSTPHEGVGGTGRGDIEGVGGTGRGDFDEGVGGTGRSGGVGGTGIYGTITGFGSICVNGERVHYDEDVPVERGAAAGATSDLAVGQRVWVVAREQGGELRAESIAIVAGASGRVTGIDATAARFEVDGRWVWLTEDTALVSASGQPAEPDDLQGAHVTVFGLEDPGGDLVATRVELHGEDGGDDAAPLALGERLAASDDLSSISVEGLVLERDDGRVRVGPVWVTVPENAPDFETGERLWLRGALTRERLVRPERIQVRPLRPVRARPDVVRRPAREPSRKLAATRPKATKARAERPERRAAAAARPTRPDRPERVDLPERPDAPGTVRPSRPERPERPERADLRAARDAHNVQAARRAQAAQRAARAARRAAKRARREARRD